MSQGSDPRAAQAGSDRSGADRSRADRGSSERAGSGRASSGRTGSEQSRSRHGASGGARRRAGRSLRQVNEYSAGGLVVDLAVGGPRGALIGRTDRQGRLLWSLPKGHIEAGETAEQAAVREVEEETGIAGVILAQLGTIDFWFVAEGRRVHKTVQHYLMRRVGGELSDADVEVDEVAWVPLTEIRAQLAYPDERGLVDTAGRLLADSA